MAKVELIEPQYFIKEAAAAMLKIAFELDNERTEKLCRKARRKIMRAAELLDLAYSELR